MTLGVSKTEVCLISVNNKYSAEVPYPVGPAGDAPGMNCCQGEFVDEGALQGQHGALQGGQGDFQGYQSAPQGDVQGSESAPQGDVQGSQSAFQGDVQGSQSAFQDDVQGSQSAFQGDVQGSQSAFQSPESAPPDGQGTPLGSQHALQGDQGSNAALQRSNSPIVGDQEVDGDHTEVADQGDKEVKG